MSYARSELFGRKRDTRLQLRRALNRQSDTPGAQTDMFSFCFFNMHSQMFSDFLNTFSDFVDILKNYKIWIAMPVTSEVANAWIKNKKHKKKTDS